MASLESFILVFIAGLLTALATGLGALPFFIKDQFSDRWTVVLWGLASGIMVSASVFGLIFEGFGIQNLTRLLDLGLAAFSGSDMFRVGIGGAIGAALVLVSHRFIEEREVDAEDIAQANLNKLILILGILTVHSFPEGVAVGVSFAELGFEGGVPILGFSVPVLAVFMTIAISIHNIPEGLAISIPVKDLGLSRWKMVGAAVFSSLPQPLGAVIAFYFVTLARQFLPYGFGFAAGAMIMLVVKELIPEALERGENLEGEGKKELAAGLVTGFLSMIPLIVF